MTNESQIMTGRDPQAILEKAAITPIQKQAALRGIADKMLVYEIP